ncbi:multidrug resistance efflux transporter family protein [Psychrobacter phenylpyruvicus]|uniref:Multidrug resistance efflux transporter n=1 Tax=Psychrobacter phenylpyruvicus TaxID=29432 RepID=A0A379LMZ3_9GAMM|nr:multidrug resistance efflux transporter family protein [Psychrobacter phenylpyruvicus]SUD91142.1 Uncharacterised protein [Psychrobacter phenylpyruvicus]
MVRLILITLIASAFFSSTYILNELMSNSGGHWFWSSSLRYLFMLIILTVMIGLQHGLSRVRQLWVIFKDHWVFWTLTGSIGFGIFYAGLCYAADHVSGWVVAATFMFTVVASLFVLMAFGHKFEKKLILYALLVLIGVILVNVSEALSMPTSAIMDIPLTTVLIYGALPCIIASFSYPIGSQLVWQASYNSRQLNITEITKEKSARRSKDQIYWDNEGFDAFEALTTISPRIISLEMDDYIDTDSPTPKVEPLPKSKLETLVAKIPTIPTNLLSNSFNKVWLMTMGSLPFWLILGLFIQPNLPDFSQVTNTLLVAFLSGVIATSIFLFARERAETSSEVAGVDATQASEVIFALVGGMVFLNNPMPSALGIAGIAIIMIGLILFAKNG